MSKKKALLIADETVRLFKEDMYLSWTEALSKAKEMYGVD